MTLTLLPNILLLCILSVLVIVSDVALICTKYGVTKLFGIPGSALKSAQTIKSLISSLSFNRELKTTSVLDGCKTRLEAPSLERQGARMRLGRRWLNSYQHWVQMNLIYASMKILWSDCILHHSKSCLRDVILASEKNLTSVATSTSKEKTALLSRIDNC